MEKHVRGWAGKEAVFTVCCTAPPFPPPGTPWPGAADEAEGRLTRPAYLGPLRRKVVLR